MNQTQPTVAEEIERYLRTGETDPISAAWPGSIFERTKRAHDELREALVREVKTLAAGRSHRPLPRGSVAELTRRKVAPMVRGLFPRVERDVVLAVLEKSVVFIRSGNIERVLTEHAWALSAWTLANLYLASVGADLLADSAPGIVGLSEHMTCYVSPEYFREDEFFGDFIVHEAAHLFHNCKRRTVGLRETRTRQWLLDINFSKREEFAYSCEAYARILECSDRSSERLKLAERFANETNVADKRFDAGEVVAIVRAAVKAGNGWKEIRARCAPPRQPKWRRTPAILTSPRPDTL